MLKRSCPRSSSLLFIAGAVIVALFAASWPALRLAKFDGGPSLCRASERCCFSQLLIDQTVEGCRSDR
jgi:hypothetical protein